MPIEEFTDREVLALLDGFRAHKEARHARNAWLLSLPPKAFRQVVATLRSAGSYVGEAVSITKTRSVEVLDLAKSQVPVEIVDATKRLVQIHPTSARIVGWGMIIWGTPLILKILAMGSLSLLGFEKDGPRSGSAAANYQRDVYGSAVPAGSPFSHAQRSGMGGLGSGDFLRLPLSIGSIVGGIWLLCQVKRVAENA